MTAATQTQPYTTMEAWLTAKVATAIAASDFFAGVDVDELLAATRIERPRDKAHGHFSLNVSPWARQLKKAPPLIAEALADALRCCVGLQDSLTVVTVAGFVNVTLSPSVFINALQRMLTEKTLGSNTAFAHESMLLEYVSANPTGPLHIGHGRWAALGDSLVRILRHCGATVTPEFYVNDAGSQMRKIGISLFLRSRELFIEAGKLPDVPLAIEYPYPGDYVTDLSRAYLAQASEADVQAMLGIWQQLPDAGPLAENNDYGLKPADIEWIVAHLQTFAHHTVMAQQQALLAKLGVDFEAWFSEKEMLYERGAVDAMLQRLKTSGFAYEKDDALWLKSEDLGDEKDRVLVKSDGQKTYLAADIAYHDQKYLRQDDNGQPQYNRVVNIWGADHHGYIARLRAAMVALGHLTNNDDPKFEIVLGQLVNLLIDGERERMGKRRKMLTLSDVVDEVGADAVRFWMVKQSADTALDFDVNLAKSANNDNPVFYVQYAHARCASIVRNALNPSQTTDTPAVPFITEADLAVLSTTPTEAMLSPLFTQDDDAANTEIAELLVLLDRLEPTVIYAATTRSPHGVARYVQDVAAQFHKVYNACRILGDDPAQTHARLAIVVAVQRTLAQGLALLGVSAPDSM